MNQIHVIGIGQGKENLTHHHLDLIQDADLLIGGTRHLAMFPNHTGENFVIKTDMTAVIQKIQDEMKSKKIVVLASGDPLFYGIGTLLSKQIPERHLVIHPNITSIGAAFAAICQSWHDARVISLHSQTDQDFLFSSLARENKIAFLTGPKKDPLYIARKLIENELDGFRVCVLENLGNPDQERITWYTDYKRIIEQTFTHPNIVILMRFHPQTKIVSHETYMGMPDEFFRHTKGLITKSEVRSISLSKLRLVKKDHLLWDIGSGSGSVGIEAAMQIPWGQVFAVEKNKSRLPDIIHNIKIFHQPNVKVVNLNFPAGHEELKSPDRVFIGGGGPDLDKIIDCCCTRIKEGGTMVINTVIMESMETAVTLLRAKGFSPQIIQVQISRSKSMPYGTRLNPLNPVWIISGSKPKSHKGKI